MSRFSLLDTKIKEKPQSLKFYLIMSKSFIIINEKNMKTLPLECMFNLNDCVEKTKGFSGRDIKQKVLKTALHKAISESKEVITDEDIDYAISESHKEFVKSDAMFS